MYWYIFRCKCNSGYEGSGEFCTEIDPCTKPNRGGCHKDVSVNWSRNILQRDVVLFINGTCIANAVASWQIMRSPSLLRAVFVWPRKKYGMWPCQCRAVPCMKAFDILHVPCSRRKRAACRDISHSYEICSKKMRLSLCMRNEKLLSSCYSWSADRCYKPL